MKDSFEKLADIIKENNLCGQALDYLADIKRELKEKERLEAVVERYQIENNALFEAYNLACKKLEDYDSILYDLYDRFDTYHPTSDRYEWKEHFLEIAEEETGE